MQDYGPYPKHDVAAGYENESLIVFQAALIGSNLAFRHEPVKDAGVDGSLEVLVEGEYSNLRSQLQLKSLQDGGVNADGTVSYSVKVTNLNYLSAGTAGLYVLYIVPRKELRYVWAKDERLRIEKANPEWMTQEKVTLRFEHVISQETLHDVRERILAEGRFNLKLHRLITSSAGARSITIGVDPNHLTHSDPNEVRLLLEQGGIMLASEGYANEVLDAFNLLNADVASSASMQLLRGYCLYMLGKYQGARAATTEAALRRSELLEEDQQLLDLIKNASDLQLGRVSPTEYLNNDGAWITPPTGAYALQQRLDYLRYAILETTVGPERIELARQIRDLAKEIEDDSSISEPSRLQARLTSLYADGQQLTFDLLQDTSYARIRAEHSSVRQNRLSPTNSNAGKVGYLV